MSFAQPKHIGKWLWEFLKTCPGLPVEGAAFSIDGLRLEGRSMSIHFNHGQVARTNINGRETIRQPFAISYQAALTDDDAAKSAMMDAIDSIGYWLASLDPKTRRPVWRNLDLGRGINVTRLRQVTWAAFIERPENNLVYLGDFVLEYSQRT